MKFILIFVAWLVVTVSSPTASGATIYKCKDPDGSTTISQFPCAKNSKPEEVKVGSGQQGRGPSGLSHSEMQVLDDTEDRRVENIRNQKKNKREQEKLARQRETLEFRCNKAKEHLATVREERRKGYSARHAEYSKVRLDEAKEYAESQCSELR